MICPDCGHDNIDGVDDCDACGQPMAQLEVPKTELEQLICDGTIHCLGPKTPISVESTATVGEAITRMLDHKIGCLLVVDAGALVGIFTERDALIKASADLSVKSQPVSQLMTDAPESLSMSDSIAFALHAMDLGGYRHMPVVNELKQPTGIVSVRDILQHVSTHVASSA